MHSAAQWEKYGNFSLEYYELGVLPLLVCVALQREQRLQMFM
jgi:hypothetical protein